MNKNIIVAGAIAAGLYLLSQGKKATKVISKKKAPRRPKRKYPKPHPQNKQKIRRVILRKKPIYNKTKIKRVIAKKKAIYNKPKIKKATTRKKPIYNKPKPRAVTARKQIIKRMVRRPRRR